jgi:hypothetical protein
LCSQHPSTHTVVGIPRATPARFGRRRRRYRWRENHNQCATVGAGRGRSCRGSRLGSNIFFARYARAASELQDPGEHDIHTVPKLEGCARPLREDCDCAQDGRAASHARFPRERLASPRGTQQSVAALCRLGAIYILPPEPSQAAGSGTLPWHLTLQRDAACGRVHRPPVPLSKACKAFFADDVSRDRSSVRPLSRSYPHTAHSTHGSWARSASTVQCSKERSGAVPA